MSVSLDQSLDQVEFAAIDLETTDFQGEPVEVAVVIVGGDGEIREEWSTLVRASTPIHPRACQVHGLRDDHLAGAPTFADVLGDLDHRLDGRVVVGHEVEFDLRTLATAYANHGHERCWPAVCTRRLGYPGTLQTEAATIGHVPTEGTWHQALPDARGAAALFRATLDAARSAGIRTLDELASHHHDVASLLRVEATPPAGLPVSGRVYTRLHRAGAVPDGLALVARTIGQLPQPLVSGDTAEYEASVWDALGDRTITGDELRQLVGTAASTDLTPDSVRDAHRRCFRRIAAGAAADHVISSPEQRDLGCVAGLLRIAEAEAEAILREEIAEALGHASTSAAPACALPTGTRVVVTGEVPYTSGGRPITRADISALIVSAGLVPKKTVSRMVDLVVACDPHSGSRKAEEARIRGIRVMMIEEFLETLGVVTD